jgi:osmotically-inducible protein OsmY
MLTKETSMKTDSELRRDVERALEWEPSIDDRRIGVAVLKGVVTLTGMVGSYSEKWKAERTVERVAGVRGIVNKLEVHSPIERTDIDIAKAAADALKWNVMVPADQVKVKVEDGWVWLTGEVNWDYQRRAAERAVRDLPGVKGITTLITLAPKVKPEHVKRKIEETFSRDAVLDADRIQVEVSGSDVTLRGTVRSWAERHEAEKAAWAAPGVTQVHNEVVVEEEAAA